MCLLNVGVIGHTFILEILYLSGKKSTPICNGEEEGSGQVGLVYLVKIGYTCTSFYNPIPRNLSIFIIFPF